MGTHSHGPVSGAVMLMLNNLSNLSTDDLADICSELKISTKNSPESDSYQWYKQRIFDHFAHLAGEK